MTCLRYRVGVQVLTLPMWLELNLHMREVVKIPLAEIGVLGDR